MSQDWSVEDIQERMRGAGQLLLTLAENPRTLRDLRTALDTKDVRAFKAGLEKGFGGFEPPAALCNPYVQVIITILKPPRYVRRCVWVEKVLKPAAIRRAQNAFESGVNAERLLELLVALGLVRCTWERESQDEVIVADKFAQGVCPPGSF